MNRDGRSIRAAHWALAERKTLRQAAAQHGCTIGAVSQTWRRIFPDVPALLNRRSGTMIQSWPEDEVTL